MFNLRPEGSSKVVRPGLAGGHYPERQKNVPKWYHAPVHFLSGIAKNVSTGHLNRIIERINRKSDVYHKLRDDLLCKVVGDFRNKVRRYGLSDDLIIEGFGLIREVAGRTIKMRHFDTQLMGGWIMIHGGLAEMETGEGKTLTATLAAATAALAGIPVHIITVNDYLVTRDVELMEPLYRALGLTVGAVTQTMGESERRVGYSCDIAYCTNKQIVFDYLRDRILLGNDQGRLRLQLERLHVENSRINRLFLRGLCFAIVDEADSVLIDEARTPLIISRPRSGKDLEESFKQAIEYAAKLVTKIDFEVHPLECRVEMTNVGRERLGELGKKFGGVWTSVRRREELMCQALAARHLYERDRHYLVQDAKIVIVDSNTGRTMADRSWERGLHQMIEIKEKCQLTGQKDHLARLTYQRFFRRYLNLAGMTGTAQEVKGELWSVYNLSVTKVPTNKPSKRRKIGLKIYPDKESKWEAIADRIVALNSLGRPVLVGTRSVGDSEHLSRILHKKGMEHQILNARQDAREAEIVATAGKEAMVTVATNMAGRGTDILLGKGVAKRGGLHIIMAECNEARRIDRQLIGRCGRQGDSGSYELVLSARDDLMKDHFGKKICNLLVKIVDKNLPLNKEIVMLITRFVQRSREHQYQNMRRELIQYDEQLSRLLAFSGRME